MNYIDLFSGILGFSLGAYWADMKFENHYISEIDPFCCELAKLRFPDAINLGDIRNHKEWKLEPGEYIITGGYPCQPFSCAGKQLQEKDDRNLWPFMQRIIRRIRPLWVVAENVPGSASYIKKTIKPELEAQNYEVWPFSISTRALRAPHLRCRLWIVAHSKSDGREGSVCGDFENGFNESWAIRESSGALDPRLSVFETFEKRVGKPAVLRMDDGIPHRVDRLKGVGNAIYPGIAELFFRQIKDVCH